ncbi:MAG: DNA polymerase III subunit delta, partial [Clostridia bacterium]|nr:DNA polymerase III subunit delta [Clostridia bacterium]
MKEDSGKTAAKKASVTVEALLEGLKQGRRYGCILLEGDEEYTKRLALDALRRTVGQDFPDMNISVLRDPAPDALIAAAETVPFMSERRLVIVKDSTLLSGKVTEFDEEKALRQMEDYLPKIPAETTVAFTLRGKADERRRMVKLMRKHALCVLCARPTDQAAQDWLVQEAKKRGRTLQGQAAAALVYTVGQSMDILSGELEKLVSYTDGRDAITEADIRAVSVPTREARVFDLTDAL